MISVIVVLAVVLGTAFVFDEAFKKLGLPSLVGQILGGLILGVPIAKSLVFQAESTAEVVD